MTKKREEASRKAVKKIIANIQSRLAKNLGERKKWKDPSNKYAAIMRQFCSNIVQLWIWKSKILISSLHVLSVVILNFYGIIPQAKIVWKSPFSERA